MTPIEIDDALKTQLDQLAARQHRSPEALVRDAIADYIERAKALADMHQEADRAWTDFQKTGLHLTGDEVDAWLETWGTEREAPAPPGHT